MSAIRSALFFTLITLLPLISKAQPGIDHWETVVFNDDTWSYRVGTSAPPANWMQPQFDDSSWPVGPGGFGYGDGDDNTTIPTTLSVCIRIQFDLTDTSNISMAVLHADYDDSFIAYLNGTEIARGNAGDTSTTLAYNDVPPTDHEAALYQGGLPEAYPVYPGPFRQLFEEGQNTLAIQVNNFLISSSDMSSNFFLSLAVNDSSRAYAPVPSWFFEPFLSTRLPLISINTGERNIVDEPKITANMKIVDNGPGMVNHIVDPGTDYDGRIGIEIRGTSSQMFEKKNYGLETRDQDGENNNVPLLGMPDENDWILHGPYSDKSLMRNALTFQIGRDMMDYASRTRFCELIINNDYRGVYLLMEKIKRDNNRVDISRVRSADTTGDELTGGYIVQVDRDDPLIAGDGWYSPHGSSPFYAFHSPDYDELAPVQKAYIKNWITDFELAMSRPDFASTYENYIDVPSFVDYFLINELTKHIDAFKLSFYMHKKKDSNGGKLHMGPIWDFNLGYSNFDFACDPNPEDWIFPCTSNVFWVDKLVGIPAVQDRMYCRWQELREQVLKTSFLLARIDSMEDELGPAVDRNFNRFDILGQYVWPNNYIGNTHRDEIIFLRNWLRQRLVWMDRNMFGNPNANCKQILDVDTEGLDRQLTVHPNPFSGLVTFSVDGVALPNGEVHIYDLRGNFIEKVNPREQTTVDLEDLAAGMYFYQYRKAGQAVQTGKLLKQ